MHQDFKSAPSFQVSVQISVNSRFIQAYCGPKLPPGGRNWQLIFPYWAEKLMQGLIQRSRKIGKIYIQGIISEANVIKLFRAVIYERS